MINPNTTKRGQVAEDLAARFLSKQGYKILKINYRIRMGEIDIIAEEDGVLCFVEVRSRKTREFGDPIETIDWKKRTRLIRAAQHYLTTHKCLDRCTRFDVVGIVYKPKLDICLIRGAFDTSGA